MEEELDWRLRWAELSKIVSQIWPAFTREEQFDLSKCERWPRQKDS